MILTASKSGIGPGTSLQFQIVHTQNKIARKFKQLDQEIVHISAFTPAQPMKSITYSHNIYFSRISKSTQLLKPLIEPKGLGKLLIRQGEKWVLSQSS